MSYAIITVLDAYTSVSARVDGYRISCAGNYGLTHADERNFTAAMRRRGVSERFCATSPSTVERWAEIWWGCGAEAHVELVG